jgi:CheY-like chemotaxis protein
MADIKSQLSHSKILILGPAGDRVLSLRNLIAGAVPGEVECLKDADEALQKLFATRFDALFLEIEEAGEALHRLLTRLRRDPHSLNPMVPVFVVLASPSLALVQKIRDLGVTDILIWPISMATLQKKLLAALSAPRPFVLGAGFMGPDRRGRAKPHRGEERRRRKARRVRMIVEAD